MFFFFEGKAGVGSEIHHRVVQMHWVGRMVRNCFPPNYTHTLFLSLPPSRSLFLSLIQVCIHIEHTFGDEMISNNMLLFVHFRSFDQDMTQNIRRVKDNCLPRLDVSSTQVVCLIKGKVFAGTHFVGTFFARFIMSTGRSAGLR